MPQEPNQHYSKPQSSRYLCIIEELQKQQKVLYQMLDQLRAQTIYLIDINRNIERIIGDGAIGTAARRWAGQQDSERMETDPRGLEIPGEPQKRDSAQNESGLSVVEKNDHDSQDVSEAEIPSRIPGAQEARKDDAEKARRLRHGEGPALEEEHF
jgi:hypothetical protein